MSMAPIVALHSKVGIRSAAVLLGDNVLLFTSICASLLVALLAYAGFVNQQGLPFFVVSVGGSALHLIWQYATLDVNDGMSCMCKSMYLHIL